MGSFEGHALPGSFFIFFGLWATINQFLGFHRSRQTNIPIPYHNSHTFKFFCLCGWFKKWEVEGFLKIFFTSIGIIIELWGGLKLWPHVSYTNMQHATMFFFFGMTGFLDIMLHHNIPLPESVAYLSACLALTAEGVLFNFHVHGKSLLDQHVHTLLVLVIFSTVIAVLIEMKLHQNVLAGLTRSFFVIVQGTWFWQVGFILYSPLPGAVPWDGNDHEQIMIATLMFVWHLGAVFVVQMVIGGAVGAMYHYRRIGFWDNSDKELREQLLTNGRCAEAGYEQVKMEEADEVV